MKTLEVRLNGPFMKVEQMPLDSLIPYVGNARKHDDKNIQEIASSILEYGFNDPIAINEVDSVIIEGHGRLLAAKRIGLVTVPVIKLGHLTKAQIKGYTLAHNRIAEKSEWDKDIIANELEKLNEMDFNIDLTGFDSDYFEDGLTDDKETKDTSKELDLDSFDNFDKTCPKCGFEWDDKK